MKERRGEISLSSSGVKPFKQFGSSGKSKQLDTRYKISEATSELHLFCIASLQILMQKPQTFTTNTDLIGSPLYRFVKNGYQTINTTINSLGYVSNKGISLFYSVSHYAYSQLSHFQYHYDIG